MSKRPAIVALAIALMCARAPALAAQDHAHAVPRAERLGEVHFQTSCARTVSRQFDRGIALLHSFEFSASARAFDAVLAVDSTCAMAWWAQAMNRWTNPMVPNVRPPALLESGGRAAETAANLGARATNRERAYISAVAQLYADYEHRDQRTRVVAYERAMFALTTSFPRDTEARIFHAIALIGSALPSDKSYANQRRAGAILEALYARLPNHPGLAHYIIHSYDVPALAGRATDAARCRHSAGGGARAAHALAHVHAHRHVEGVDRNEPALVRRRSPRWLPCRGVSCVGLRHLRDPSAATRI
jgi:hypothetical protein